MLKGKSVLKVAAGVLLAGSVAYADARGPNQQRTPVDTRGASGQQQGSSFFSMNVNVSNDNDHILVGAVFASTTAHKRGTTTSVEVKKFVLDSEIEVDQINTVTFLFRSANFGRG